MRTDTFKDVSSHQRYKIVAVFLLILATAAVYSQVWNFEFITFDDDVYVYSEPHVKEGLTIESVIWCLKNSHAFNWHPLTSISLFLNASVFGLSPGSFHLVNVAFHIFNSLLLLLVFLKMTGSFWRSLFIASLFALHPLHVESVAWVSERKDVLSAFFWFLTMLCYWWYTVSPRLTRYAFVVVSLILGLLAKPMLVTLPFVLLLMDYWPLGRWKPGASMRTAYSLIAEKVPLLLIIAIFSVVTFLVQKSTGIVKNLVHYPLYLKIPNVLVQYVEYLKDMVWPFHLSIFYPYPQKIEQTMTVLAGFMLLAATLAVVWYVRKLPYLAIGWFWYLGTLIPVIGIVQVGGQARADRYTYLPLIGIFIIIAWGMPDLFARFRHKRTLLSIAAVLVMIGCMVTTWFQVGYWKDCLTLYTHALKVTEDNFWAHNLLGATLASNGQVDEAIDHFHQALAIKPNFTPPNFHLGVIYMKRGEYDKAIKHFQTVLMINPSDAETHAYLGMVYSALNNQDESIHHFTEALKIKPQLTFVHLSLAKELLKKNRPAEAAIHLQEYLKTNPSSTPARINLGITLSRMNRLDEAVRQFSVVTQSNPGSIQALMMFNTTTQKILGIESEIQRLEAVPDRNSTDPGILYKLATLNSWIGENDKAARYLLRIIEIQPNNPNGYYNLACIYSKQNRIEEAVRYLQEAVNRGFKDWKMLHEDPDLFNIRDNQYVKNLLKKL